MVAPGESHFFIQSWARDPLRELPEKTLRSAITQVRSSYGGRYRDELDADLLLERTLEVGGTPAALYRCFIETLCRVAEKTYFCDDTPRHAFHAKEILRALPEARVIACIRDPRAYLCSYKFQYRIHDPPRLRATYHPVLTPLLWRGAVTSMQTAELTSDRLQWLRYEDLVAKPESEVRRICEFLSLDYSEELIQIESRNSSFGETAPGIRADTVDRWRTELNVEEQALAEWVGKSAMKTFDYARERPRYRLWRLVLLGLTTPLALLRAIWWNRNRVGAVPHFLKQRAASIFGSVD